MISDRLGLEVLDEAECLRLLDRVAVVRVAMIAGGLPRILPMNACVADGDVWFRVGRGAMLDAALAGDVIAVEADEIDRLRHGGWSVVVTGRAEVAADRSDLRITPWGRPDADHLVRVRAEIVTGRRL